MRRTFDNPVVIGVVLMVALLLLIAGLTYRNTRQLNEDARSVAHTHVVMNLTSDVMRALVDAETGQQGFLITGKDEFLQPYDAGLVRLDGLMVKLKDKTKDNSVQQSRITKLEEMTAVRLGFLKEGIDLRRKSAEEASAFVITGKGKAQMDAIRQHISEMEQIENDLLKERESKTATTYRDAVTTGLLTAVLGLIAVGAFVWLLARSLRTRQKAAAIVSEQRERLRTTLASIGDAVISTDAEGRISNMNAVAESLTAWTNAEAMGQPLDAVFRIVNEETRQPVHNPATRALKEGVIVGLANHTVLIAKDGTERCIDDSAAPIRCKDGEIVGCVLVFRDISERRKADMAGAGRNRLTSLRADTSAALNLSDDPRIALQECTAALVRHLDVAFARIWTLNEAGTVLELQASAGLYTHLDGPHGRVTVGEFKIGRIAQNRQPLLTNDVPHDPNISDTAWAEREGMVAFAGYPLLVGEEVVGVMAMFARTPIPENVLEDLRPIAAGIAQFIDRKRAEETGRASEERYRVLYAALPVAAFVCDRNAVIQNYNPRAAELWGREPKIGVEQHCGSMKLILPDGTLLPHAQSPMMEVLRTGVSARNIEVLIERPDGSRIPVLVNFCALRDARGEIVGVVTSFDDITERKQAEEALRDSKDRVVNIVESITDAFVTVDKEWRFTFLNQRAKEILLPLKGNFLGKNLWAELPDLIGTPAEANYRRCMNEQVTVGFELFYPPLHGWFEVRAYPSKDGLSIYFQDVTERKRAEDSLRESDDRYRAAIEAVSDLIWTNSVDGLMEGEQQGWGDFTGQSHDEYQGYGWSKAVHPEDAQPTIDEWNRAVAEKRIFVFEHRVHRRDGEWRLCSIRAVPILNADGKIREWVGVHTDITERKRDEEKLRQLAADLSEAHHRKDEFLATLAHELRNPLAPIRNGLQLMKLVGGQPANIEQTRSMMERQLTQMVRLVDDLMDVSRISRGKLELRKERVPLAAVLSSAVETSRPLIEQMGHELTVTLPKLPLIVDADMTRLAQVFLNLLNNAAKYGDRGGHIQLNVERQGSDVVVTVKDTGIGIAADQLPRIFEMFTQVDRSLEKSQGGLGIGLTLVKRLVEMHGGRVEARSEGPGKGSEFVVRLPLAIELMRNRATDEEKEQPAGKSSLRILIVDDNRDGADSLSMMLEIMGNDTRTAYDGQQGVDMAGEFRPDVVLLDIGLPKLNGYEACRRIREQSWGEGVMLIAVTGWGQDEDRRRSQEAGFDHHMVKPVDPQDLMKMLAGLEKANA